MRDKDVRAITAASSCHRPNLRLTARIDAAGIGWRPVRTITAYTARMLRVGDA
jgi:hypothetical protein